MLDKSGEAFEGNGPLYVIGSVFGDVLYHGTVCGAKDGRD